MKSSPLSIVSAVAVVALALNVATAEPTNPVLALPPTTAPADHDHAGHSGGPVGPTQRAPSADDLIGNIFGTAKEVTRKADDMAQGALGLSIAERIEIGRKFNEQIMQGEKRLIDEALQARVEALARPILESRKASKEIPFTITLIDSPTVNAFAHEGGYLYVYKGLLDMVGDDDAQLQFVMGHEIGHVELGHTARGAAIAKRTGDLLGDFGVVAQAAYGAIACGYSEDFEFEADAYGYKTGHAVGRVSKTSAIAVLRALKEAVQQTGQKELPKDTSDPTVTPTPPMPGNDPPPAKPAADGPLPAPGILDELLRGIDNHFQTHPPADDRIKRIEEMED